MQCSICDRECPDDLGWSEELVDLDHSLDEQRVVGGWEGKGDGAEAAMLVIGFVLGFDLAHTECQADLSAGG